MTRNDWRAVASTLFDLACYFLMLWGILELIF